MNSLDLVGKKFNNLTVIEILNEFRCNRNRIYLKCICDCGKEKNIYKFSVTSGLTTSCGCIQKNIIKSIRFKHGMARTKGAYTSWLGMKRRCNNKSDKAYSEYGGRGISICESWQLSFENFFKDMGSAPKNHSLDRINNDGNYEPGNCRWATKKEQNNNRRKRRWKKKPILVNNP